MDNLCNSYYTYSNMFNKKTEKLYMHNNHEKL